MPEVSKTTVIKVLAAMIIGEIVDYDDICARVPDQARKTIRFAMRQLVEEGLVDQVGKSDKNVRFKRVELCDA